MDPKSISNKSSTNPSTNPNKSSTESSIKLPQNPGKKRKMSGAMQRKLKRALLREQSSAPKAADPANKVLQVVVCREEQPTFFTSSEMSAFESSLNEAVKYASRADLQFLPTHLSFKQILVTPANQSSRDWFLHKLDSVKPFGPDVVLVARDPALFIYKKVILWVADERHPSTTDVLATLEKQNVPLACCKWRVVERKERPVGLKFNLELDRSSVQRIQNKDLKLWYKDTMAEIEILEEHDKSKTPKKIKSLDKEQDAPIVIE